LQNRNNSKPAQREAATSLKTVVLPPKKCAQDHGRDVAGFWQPPASAHPDPRAEPGFISDGNAWVPGRWLVIGLDDLQGLNDEPASNSKPALLNSFYSFWKDWDFTMLA